MQRGLGPFPAAGKARRDLDRVGDAEGIRAGKRQKLSARGAAESADAGGAPE